MMQVRNSDLHKEEYERRDISRQDTFLIFLKILHLKVNCVFQFITVMLPWVRLAWGRGS